jgi:hypothetical protein
MDWVASSGKQKSPLPWRQASSASPGSWWRLSVAKVAQSSKAAFDFGR